MTLEIFTDGGSINNPGNAAIGYLIFQDKGLIKKFSKKIGIASNNFAEYTALIEALTDVDKYFSGQKERPEKIICYSDSSLMVNQLNGFYKVKNADMRSLLFKVRALEGKIKTSIVYVHIPREKNTKADALVKAAL